MEQKIRLVTDSTAYLPAKTLQKYPFIDIVPLSVNFEDDNMLDYVENNSIFVEKLENSDNLPTTSRPSPEQFLEVFRPVVQAGGEVICITLSSKLSGTYESALTAAREVDEEKITVIDSKVTAAGLAYLAEQAAELVLQGKKRKEIVDIITEKAEKIKIVLIPATLEYLKKGGRIGGAKAFLGTIMNIKPILYVTDGKVEALDKVRTTKKALARLVDEMPADAKRIVVAHLMAPEVAEKIKALIANKATNARIDVVELGPVISVHVGPGVVGAILCD